MLPKKTEIIETLSTLKWGDGWNVCFYDLSGKDVTAQVHAILGVANHEKSAVEVGRLDQFIKKCRLEGIGWRQILALWIRSCFRG